jgi:hypothetical protein
MRTSRIDIKRDKNILQLENWPTAIAEAIDVSSKLELVIESESTDTVVSMEAHVSMPKCQDGVCQLGDWKPKRNVA